MTRTDTGKHERGGWLRTLAGLGAAALLAFGPLQAQADPTSLRARHAELRDALRNNQYQRPMVIASSEADGGLRGDVYAVLDHPFSQVSAALKEPAAWCDIMLLPFNTKACQARGNAVQLRIGRKAEQPAEQAYRLDLRFRNMAARSDYFESRLNAQEGPFGTRDYRIRVSAIPLEGNRTFMHMHYAYGVGGMGRLAMQAYLATAGADKVGFTSNGMRGAVERNAMRYYLAIDAYLDTLDAAEDQQVDKRINHWFTATERYPKQLHEMDRATYVAMKRREYEQQPTVAQQ